MDAELAAARESWRGASYDEVVAAWGPPAQSAKDSHTWLSEDRMPPRSGVGVYGSVGVGRSSGGSGVGMGVGGVIFSAPSGETAARCDRTLAFHEGRVADERWTGDPAFCKRFARPRR